MEKPYCVLETLENGKRCFFAAPKSWIFEDTLLWPPTNQLYRARKNYAEPKNNWKKFQIVKLVQDNIGM